MKNVTCPKCGANEMLNDLAFQAGSPSPHVEIIQPRPEKPPFMWIPDLILSQFTVDVCGACGYAELHAIKYKELNEGRKKATRTNLDSSAKKNGSFPRRGV